MEKCFIDLKDIDLVYPSAPFAAMSLKEIGINIFKGKRPPKLIHDIYALKTVSLHVTEGERLGIIGANGSGKSTILKTIASIYKPLSGQITTKGSIRALFELSLGFDILSTGRENIMYRGLLLGETPSSMREREQEIIEFADIGEFIDYPVKVYSAGMLVRLAFAISTTIQGDILLLDEVIGAGDVAFSIKARKRINELIERSKIMVLVSHDFQTISDICSRVIWLSHGVVVQDGLPDDVIQSYLKASMV